MAADKESRIIDTSKEWMLNPTFLYQALDKLQAHPNVDTFASRLNEQFPRYMSYRPDPGAESIDAFSAQWTMIQGYYSPSFSVIPKVLQKLQQDQATGVVVIPRWPTQAWYSAAMKMLISHPVLLQHNPKLLLQPSHPQEVHPLHRKLDVLVYHLSGDNCRQADFYKERQISSCVLEELEPKSNTTPTLQSGKATVAPKGLTSFSFCS